MSNGILFINSFPDIEKSKFDAEKLFERKFKELNVIIDASTSNFFFPDHWGPLSVKCVMKGSEYYRSDKTSFTVTENNYLVFNEGRRYSSYIYSDKPVQTFNICFCPDFVKDVLTAIKNGIAKTLDDPFQKENLHYPFFEKLYLHDQIVSPVIYQIQKLSANSNQNSHLIAESLYTLFYNLLSIQSDILKETNCIKAIRQSTKIEIYKRLSFVKDHLDSSYFTDIDLKELTKISLLSTFHLLRHFKGRYGVTPHQYLMEKRLEKAKLLLSKKNISVTEICSIVGYHDLSSFSKLFKRKFGLSPEAFQHQKRCS